MAHGRTTDREGVGRSRLLRALLAVGAALATWLGSTSQAPAASLLHGGCLIGAPSDWVSAPSKPDDQFVVQAPKAYAGLADKVAGVIRPPPRDIFEAYEDRLQIPALGIAGQQKPFEVFLDPELKVADPGADGVTEPRCFDSGRVAVDVDATIADPDELDATVAHELFHAAQARLGGLFEDNWWYEATATWAEARWGYEAPRSFSTTVTNHPGVPMDAFGQPVDGVRAHEYGAWTFVAWLFSRHKIKWPDMRESFVDAAHAKPTPVINGLLQDRATSFGDEVASYWADHTRQKPEFGPTGKLSVDKVSEGTENNTVAPADKYGARLLALRPTAKTEQLELIVPKLPAGVQAWINLGDGKFWRLDSGSDFDETFCRSGATSGSLPLPGTGDVRLAITTTSGGAPSTLDFKTIGVSKPCPKQFEIQRGKAIGPLHLGMSTHSANQAVPKHHKTSGPIPTPLGEYKTYEYVEGHKAGVLAGFFDGRIAYLLIISNNHFVTTDGVGTYWGVSSSPGLIPGSALADFKHDHCLVSGDGEDKFCWREGPKTRFTVALANVLCDSSSSAAWCPLPNDFYIGSLAVATHKGLEALKKAFGALGKNEGALGGSPVAGRPPWLARLRRP